MKKKSYFKKISLAASIVIVAFLILPVIFPQDAKMISRKLAAKDASASAQQGLPSLPVVFSDNPLTKYFKKLAKFYHFNKNTNKPNFEQNPLYAYNDDDSATDGSNEVQGVFSVDTSSKSGPVYTSVYTTSDGIIVKPETEGYYYGGKYYKNGTYPSSKLKNSIESVIASYHENKAAEKGLKALYFKDPDGSMKVKYVSQKDYDGYFNRMANGGSDAGYASADGSYGGGSLGSSGRYSGAQILGNESASNDSKSAAGKSSVKYGATLGDLGRQFANLSAGLAMDKDRTAKQTAADSQKKKEEEKRKEFEFLLSARKFMNYIFVEPSRWEHARYDEAKFGDKPLVMDSSLFNRFFKFGFGLKEEDFPGLKTAVLSRSSKNPNPDYYQNLKQVVGNDPSFRVLGGVDSAEVYHNLKKNFPDMKDNVFFDRLVTPENDPSLAIGHRKAFTQAFVDETGIRNVLKASGVSETKIKEIEEKYKTLDTTAGVIKKEIKKTLDSKPVLRGLRTSATFMLGKDDNGDIVVASPKSFLYVYSPAPPPDWIVNKYATDPKKPAYLHVNPSEGIGHIKDNGNVLVLSTKPEISAAQDLGAGTVAFIPALACYTPSCLYQNIKTLGEGVYAETRRVANNAQKATMDSSVNEVYGRVEKNLSKETQASIDNIKNYKIERIPVGNAMLAVPAVATPESMPSSLAGAKQN